MKTGFTCDYMTKSVKGMQNSICTGGHIGKSNMAFPVKTTVKQTSDLESLRSKTLAKWFYL